MESLVKMLRSVEGFSYCISGGFSGGTPGRIFERIFGSMFKEIFGISSKEIHGKNLKRLLEDVSRDYLEDFLQGSKEAIVRSSSFKAFKLWKKIQEKFQEISGKKSCKVFLKGSLEQLSGGISKFFWKSL